MKNRNTLLIFTLIALASCSLNIKRAQKNKSPVDPGAIKETPNMPPQINYEDLGASNEDKWEVDKVVVWMEGIGVDSYYYLGFLQEVEKSGFDFKKIIGTGSACWIAQSWASEDKGSYAEWQSFKLESWDVLKRGLLDRWTSENSLESFEKKMKNIQPARIKRLFKIKHDCPLLIKRADNWVESSSKYLALSEELWVQLQIPQIVNDLDLSSMNKRSGLKVIPPTDKEVNEWFDFNNQHDRETTLVLILSNPQVRKEFGERNSSVVKKRLANGLRVWRVELGHKILNNTKIYKDFNQRRLFMLEGRKEAIDLLKNPANREFLGLELYPKK